MKHTFPLLSAASIIAMLVSTSANAVDGTITINGEITDTTCSIAVNGGTADATVQLPTVAASALTASGDTAGTTPFSIALSGCSGTALGMASSWFEPGANVDTTTGRLNNSGGTATNVQVELLNSNQDPIFAGGATQNDVPVDISSGSGTLNYFARYYAIGGATAGTVSTSVQYTIVYQ